MAVHGTLAAKADLMETTCLQVSANTWSWRQCARGHTVVSTSKRYTAQPHVLTTESCSTAEEGKQGCSPTQKHAAVATGATWGPWDFPHWGSDAIARWAEESDTPPAPSLWAHKERGCGNPWSAYLSPSLAQKREHQGRPLVDTL